MRSIKLEIGSQRIICAVCVVGAGEGGGTYLGDEGAIARHLTREGLQFDDQRAQRHGSNGPADLERTA
jgi:hypothetical protein